MSTSLDNIKTELYPNHILDIAYGEHREQKLDLYLPEKGKGPFPVIIFLHGGAFMYCDKRGSQVRPFLRALKNEYAVISANYRLAPETKYPEAIFDVKAVIAWVKNLGCSYGLDENRIALTGKSAGAYYAVMTAATQGRREFDGWINHDTRVQAVVDLYGPSVFPKMKEHFEESGIKPSGEDSKGDWTPEEIFMGAKFEQIQGLLRFANPNLYIDENMPPTLIQHGKRDQIVPYQQSLVLAEAIARNAGKARVTLEFFEDYSHADVRFGSDENMDRIFRFLDRYLK